MAVSFNPFKANQGSANNEVLQTQGNNVFENHSTSSPYTVPNGADYVMVSFDAATTITATPLSDGNGGELTGYSVRFEGAGQVEIPNVLGGKTIITTVQA